MPSGRNPIFFIIPDVFLSAYEVDQSHVTPYYLNQPRILPLVRQLQLWSHVQTAWIWIRRIVTRRLTQNQAV